MNESGDPMNVRDEVDVTDGRRDARVDEGPRLVVREAREESQTDREAVFDVKDLAVYYGDFRAVRDVTLPVWKNDITALIGPSGCGKSTLLRCLNRMNDLIEGAKVSGQILYHGAELYAPGVDAVEVRRRIGMVFQKPNPFPKSIYDNVAFGPRINGIKGNMDDIVEQALRSAALW